MNDLGLRSCVLARRLATLAGVFLVWGSASGTGVERFRIPEYVPQDFIIPANASYRNADGAIIVVGYNDMRQMLEKLNAIFGAAHPGIHFDLRLQGTATAAPALAFGISAFAPMGAEFSHLELAAYRALKSQAPLQIRVSHCALDPRARSAPLAIVVNRLNPIRKLTIQQLRRVFATGDPRGDITRWGQLGAAGDWSRREIHPVGIAEERTAGLANYMLSFVTNGLPFAPAFDGLFQSRNVILRVGEDPSAIGFASANLGSTSVRMLAIARTSDDGYFLPSVDNVISDRYPLNRHLFIYVNRTNEGQVDPLVREYLRLMLSKEGQATITRALPGYLPLNAEEVAEELEKIN